MVKILFVYPEKSPDHLGSVLWDGLQDVLGPENVIDVLNSVFLEPKQCPDKGPLPSMAMRSHRILWAENRDFDGMVVISSFLRHWGWRALSHLYDRLRHGARVAYVEGWDAATGEVCSPEGRVDVVFRKEIEPGFRYPYPSQPIHLSFAAPQCWFGGPMEDGNRPIDVFFFGRSSTCGIGTEHMRTEMLSHLFRTRKKHKSLIATTELGFDEYMGFLRKSKVALCPSAADGADSMRTYEAMAAGAIPILVGYPGRPRDPWIPNGLHYNCTVENVAEHVDEALAHDQTEKRRALVEYAKQHHTTAVRARKVLDAMGITP